MLQMLYCITKNERKLKMLIQFLVNTIKKIIGKQKRGKERLRLEKVVCGILYYLRTGCTWRFLPPAFGNFNTIAGWFRKLSKLEIFSNSWIHMLKQAQKYGILKLKHILFDGSLTCAFSDVKNAEKNARNRNKRSLNRQLLTDSQSIPLAFILAKGNSHDTSFAIELIDRASEYLKLPHNFYGHGDKGYDSLHNRWQISQRGGIACIPVRNIGYKTKYPKQKDKYRPHVERSFAWINRFKATINITLRSINTIFQAYTLVFICIASRFFNFKNMKNLIGSI